MYHNYQSGCKKQVYSGSFERLLLHPTGSIDNTSDEVVELAKRDPAAIEKIIVGFTEGKREQRVHACKITGSITALY